jgi:hypothetical protein
LADPQPISDYRHTLIGELQPVDIIEETPIFEITITEGWEANFERRRQN